MSEGLPKNWALCSFMEIFDIQGGTQPPKSEFIFEANPNYVRLLQIRDFGDKPVPTYIPFKPSLKFCKKDDILIGRYGASIGRICSGGEGAYNVALAKVLIPRYINKRFVFFLLKSNSFQEPILKTERSAQDGFNKDDLKQVILPICPVNEQRRIVAKLEKLLAKVDACKERLEKIPAILKRFRQSVLAAFCSGRLTADWRELNHSDANWKTGKLSEVAHSRLGKMLDKSKNQGALTPYLRNINVRWFGFDLKDIQNIKVTQKEAEALSILPGDVLVCEGGEPGRCAIWKGESGAFVYQKALHRIRVGSALLPEWVCYSLKTAADSGQLMNLFTGTTIKHLTGISLGELQLDLPPVEEQHEIVRRVEALFKIADDIEKRYQKAKAHVDKLTQSILAKAFRGELVPQDPNDEPAAELLKRIQAERKNQEAEARPGQKSTRRRVRPLNTVRVKQFKK